MRALAFLAILLANTAMAQDARTLARAIERGNTHALDHWMERELHRQRKGVLVTTSSASYTIHSPTYDSLVTWLRRQPGVVDAEWDRCINKIMIWPGHSTLGVRVQLKGGVSERCYTLQEGRPGTIQLFGWRPRVRKSREELKLVQVKECAGFVAEQRRICAGLAR